eukprot:531377-Pelagomonas_calceolata.AAC.3
MLILGEQTKCLQRRRVAPEAELHVRMHACANAQAQSAAATALQQTQRKACHGLFTCCKRTCMYVCVNVSRRAKSKACIAEGYCKKRWKMPKGSCRPPPSPPTKALMHKQQQDMLGSLR